MCESLQIKNDEQGNAVESACRVARLESECMQGEGMTFNFLESPHCNLFDVEGTTNKLSCVGWWREDSYTFILATDNGINVQYAMRYEAMKSSNIDETLLLLYFSPICPTIKKGSPPSQVMHTLLKLNRPGISLRLLIIQKQFFFCYRALTCTEKLLTFSSSHPPTFASTVWRMNESLRVLDRQYSSQFIAKIWHFHRLG
ncbi:hypothetical protein HELRODRAFT_170042 [Helobdella robusta]|uniref:Uncharacterized protein n=1 Tax=Helobdella robusta TaxID=6412 RepID=T1F2K6_HELRO|nr:hypothetical protein HELRODRAFT_170042 [Helobdella robusta]ESO07505.1 hypothetical protein HELRODRAFT_170042 [Helobdella robusta]